MARKFAWAMVFALLLNAGIVTVLPTNAQDFVPRTASEQDIFPDEQSSPQASVATDNLSSLVPNFAVVSNELWRGGLPRTGALRELKNAGAKTVINLMQAGKEVEQEKAQAKELGLNFYHMPMSHFKTPSQSHIDHFLSIVKNPENQPVFVHCHQGQDRAGTMVAMYRIKEQGWTAGRAYDEMLAFGFHPFFLNLTSSVYSEASALGRPEQQPSAAHIVADLRLRVKRALSF